MTGSAGIRRPPESNNNSTTQQKKLGMRIHARTTLLSISAALCAFGQGPDNTGYIFDGVQLPGNPRAVIALNGDGQDCAFQCMAELDCVAFNYEPSSCSDMHCPHPSGCCWLLSRASSGNTTSTKCASSMMIRPPAGSIPPPPPPPPPPLGAKNVIYILVDDLRPDVSRVLI